jgi:hypothetical protein
VAGPAGPAGPSGDAAGAVRYDQAQTLTGAQQTQAQNNMSAPPASGVLRVDVAQPSLTAAQKLMAQANLGIAPPLCGRLTYQSGGVLLFKPLNGNKIKVGGAIYDIPNAGIVGLGSSGVYVNGSPGLNLAPYASYLVAVFNNAGTPTANFLTSLAHGPDTTAGNEGTEVPNGQPTNSVIGMCHTGGSAQFVDFMTLSWLNRRGKVSNNPVANLTTGSTVSVDMTSGVPLITWGDEPVWAGFLGQTFTNDSIVAAMFVGIDSADTALRQIVYPGTGNNVPTELDGWLSLTEGYHYLTGRGAVSSGGSTLYVNNAMLLLKVAG